MLWTSSCDHAATSSAVLYRISYDVGVVPQLSSTTRKRFSLNRKTLAHLAGSATSVEEIASCGHSIVSCAECGRR